MRNILCRRIENHKEKNQFGGIRPRRIKKIPPAVTGIKAVVCNRKVRTYAQTAFKKIVKNRKDRRMVVPFKPTIPKPSPDRRYPAKRRKVRRAKRLTFAGDQ